MLLIFNAVALHYDERRNGIEILSTVCGLAPCVMRHDDQYFSRARSAVTIVCRESNCVYAPISLAISFSAQVRNRAIKLAIPLLADGFILGDTRDLNCHQVPFRIGHAKDVDRYEFVIRRP